MTPSPERDANPPASITTSFKDSQTSMDFHTHNLHATPGTAIVNLPREFLLKPDSFIPQPSGLYSAGIHPWWTDSDVRREMEGLQELIRHPQVVALGECGLDAFKGGDMETQVECFRWQVALSETAGKPMTIHCVRAFHELLYIHRSLHPRQTWTIHGFRGKPALARQLLNAGFNLSFGHRYNPESYALTPEERRHHETDDAPQTPEKGQGINVRQV